LKGTGCAMAVWAFPRYSGTHTATNGAALTRPERKIGGDGRTFDTKAATEGSPRQEGTSTLPGAMGSGPYAPI
jgi:hypothetical protein